MHAAFVGKYRWTNLSARLDLLKVTSTIGYGQNDGLTNGQNDGQNVGLTNKLKSRVDRKTDKFKSRYKDCSTYTVDKDWENI